MDWSVTSRVNGVKRHIEYLAYSVFVYMLHGKCSDAHVTDHFSFKVIDISQSDVCKSIELQARLNPLEVGVIVGKTGEESKRATVDISRSCGTRCIDILKWDILC